MASLLIVEDCVAIAAILARHLTGAGYDVTIAHDGVAALDHVSRRAPDCILLDLMMPVMTGIELLHWLKEDPATATIPVVLVSARIGEGRTHVFAERDADHCVGKPFTRQQVLDAVRAVLNARPGVVVPPERPERPSLQPFL
jgi:CheY-like chemotaxis protein